MIINSIRNDINESPKTPDSGKQCAGNSMWKELLLITLGTAIAIVLTFGTAAWIKHAQSEKSHRQTALIAIGDIHGFSQQLQKIQDEFFTPWKVMLAASSQSGCLTHRYIDQPD